MADKGGGIEGVAAWLAKANLMQRGVADRCKTPSQLANELHNGVILVKLACKLDPNNVGPDKVMGRPSIEYHRRLNVNTFIEAYKRSFKSRFRIAMVDVGFTPDDIENSKNIEQVVTAMHKVAKKIESQELPAFIMPNASIFRKETEKRHMDPTSDSNCYGRLYSYGRLYRLYSPYEEDPMTKYDYAIEEFLDKNDEFCKALDFYQEIGKHSTDDDLRKWFLDEDFSNTIDNLRSFHQKLDKELAEETKDGMFYDVIIRNKTNFLQYCHVLVRTENVKALIMRKDPFHTRDQLSLVKEKVGRFLTAWTNFDSLLTLPFQHLTRQVILLEAILKEGEQAEVDFDVVNGIQNAVDAMKDVSDFVSAYFEDSMYIDDMDDTFKHTMGMDVWQGVDYKLIFGYNKFAHIVQLRMLSDADKFCWCQIFAFEQLVLIFEIVDRGDRGEWLNFKQSVKVCNLNGVNMVSSNLLHVNDSFVITGEPKRLKEIETQFFDLMRPLKSICCGDICDYVLPKEGPRSSTITIEYCNECGRLLRGRINLGLRCLGCRKLYHKDCFEGLQGDLWKAVRRGDIEEVRRLQSLGVEVNVTEKGRSVLSEAARHNHKELVTILLEAGANPFSDLGQWAAEKRHYDIIQKLIDLECLNEVHLGPTITTLALKMDHQMIGLILPHINLEHLHETLRFKDKDGKTALEWAFQTGDKFSISHLLSHEQQCHQDKVSGMKCIKEQLTYEANLKSIIEQFSDLYEKGPWEKRLVGIMALLPVLLSFSLYSFDTISDSVLSRDYHSCSDLVGNLSSALTNGINCAELNRTSEEYTTAFITNVGLITTSVGASLVMVMFSSGIHGLIKHLWNEESRGRTHTILLLCLFSTLIFPPLFILASHAYLKYQHTTTSKKDTFLEHLQSSEFYWGVLNMLEAGIESSLQLVLQTWMISNLFTPVISNLFTPGGIDIDGFPGIVRGILLLEGASSLERSLGKMLVSLASVVVSIGGCYRYQKRGSISLVDMIPIFIMLLTSIMGRIAAFAAFFSTGAKFGTWMPVLYLLHTSAVIIIKLIWEVDCHCGPNQEKKATFKRFLIAILGSAASFLVYVSIKGRDHKSGRGTFHLHLYFFLLILVENILLAVSPLMVQDGTWSDGTWPLTLPFVVLGLWILSCLSHLIFYRLFGHPWGALNGPEDKSCKGLLCGSVCQKEATHRQNDKMYMRGDTIYDSESIESFYSHDNQHDMNHHTDNNMEMEVISESKPQQALENHSADEDSYHSNIEGSIEDIDDSSKSHKASDCNEADEVEVTTGSVRTSNSVMKQSSFKVSGDTSVNK